MPSDNSNNMHRNVYFQWKVNGTIPSEAFSAICRNLLKFHNGMSGIMPDSQITVYCLGFSTLPSSFTPVFRAVSDPL